MSTTTFTALPTANTIDGSADFLAIDTASLATTQRINRNTLLGISGSPVGTSDSQTLSNKVLGNTSTITLKDTLFTLQDDGDVTKQAKFQLSGITTATTRTYTLPNASSTLADIATAQTFTNKTLTGPVITGGSIDNSTITVDSISGHTTPTIVTVGGVQMNNGTIGTSGAVVTASIAAGAVVPNSLVASSGSGWSWQSFTPTWTNLAVGNAVQTFYYTQIGKTILFEGQIILGTTSAVATTPIFTLPVNTSSRYDTSHTNIFGNAWMEAGGSNFIGLIVLNGASGANKCALSAQGVASTYLIPETVTATVPGTWASGNTIILNGSYQVD